ncbi:TonB-dependent receptor [Sphingomonas sp. BK235]|uniref:TonB-dependent receptor n=1 Tax=Sphingomonas sp. BK235 TaxID=2512131 RepID=UPI001048DB36|nr:TonB-dependent receptor [Sphingomonas sp. BK235]TCP36694.1 outer membrane receptor for ferrienterochelin and colicin [Sphingomonas sp. BK235]
MTTSKRMLTITTAVAALLAAGTARAQAAPEDAAETARPQGEEVVVTAQKREQTLIDVPQSVSVVGGEALERNQATSFKDYLKLVPGLQLNQTTPGFGRLVLRGINTGGVASTVAVYQDETVFGSSSGLVNGGILAGDFDTFDVARIEVLRGPQGTLYGANALGGILKFVTNKPEFDRIELRARGSVEAVKGGRESYLGSAVINLPLAETLAVRASGFYRDIGGFIDSVGTGGSDVARDINGSRSYGGRASLLFQPSAALSIQLSANLQNLDVDASDSVDADPTTGRTLYGRLTQSRFSPEPSDIRYRVYNGVVDYDLGFASIVSATSYSTLAQRFSADLTPSIGAIVEEQLGVANDFAQLQRTEVKRFTQELRLQSPASTMFEWLVGGYYSHEKGRIDQDYLAYTPGTTTPVAGLPLLGLSVLDSRYEEVAGFANATLHLGRVFDLTFGGRYSHNSQRADQTTDGALTGAPLTILPTARSKEDVFTWSVSPKINLGERAAVYARVAKGFRPGGPNALSPDAPPELRTYDSDSLVSYEAGVKAETSDRSFAIDLAAFHIDWSDIQVIGQIGQFGLNFNGGKARSDGFEFTATLRPTRGLVTSLNGAYTDAKLRDDTPEQVGGLRGDRLPYTPEWSVAANADYEWSVGRDAQAFVGGSIRLLSDQPASYNASLRAANGRQASIDGYEVVDLRAGVDFGRFSVEVYAKNLTDVDGKTSLDLAAPPNAPFGAASAGVIRPRTVGVTLGAGF